MTVKGPHNEDFEDFFQCWTDIQKQLLEELLQMLQTDIREDELQKLVQKVVKHYEHYYEAKHSAARQDILETMTAPWKTPMEKAFMWIGGWRPTMVFQLAYAEAGQMIEAELANFLEGIDIPSMAGLSAKQLELINNLQKQTLKEEEELSHRMAMLQQGMADQPLLSLAEQVVTVLQPSNEGEDATSIFEDAVDEKLKLLEDLLIDADNLRKESLIKMLKILTTIQSAQYLAAAGQLQVALRKVGEIRERKATEVELTSSFPAEDIKDSRAAMAF